jgi:HK97 family phage major capsid protein
MDLDREFRLGAAKRDGATGDLSVEMAFASEEPYERWWGVEILDISEKSVRLGRLNDGAPLLFNHDWNDLRGTHVPGSVRADKDRVLRGQVRIESVTQKGRDTIGLVERGILVKASVGYRIHKVVEQSTTKDGQRIEREHDGALFRGLLSRAAESGAEDRGAFFRALDAAAGRLERADDEPVVFRIVDFEPLENSLVTVPADNSVGIGRTAGRPAASPAVSQPAAAAAHTEAKNMADSNTAAAGVVAEVQVQQPAAAVFDPVQATKDHREAVNNLCRANKLDERYADHWIQSGASWKQISDDLVRILDERGRNNPQGLAKLDLEAKDVRHYSVMRALRSSMSRDWKNAGLELECNREISKRLNKLPRTETSFFVPLDVMMRDMTAAGVSGSNYLIGTQNRPGNFIDLLSNTSVGLRMGVQRLPGLVGNVTIPKMTAGNTAYWLSDETTQITESQPTIGQLSLSPKNVAALTELSHQLISQSTPDAEQLVLTRIARDIGLALDVGILRGSGASGQPQGIVGTSGVGSVSGTSLAAAGVLEFQSDVAANNGLMPGCGYVTTPAVAALLSARPELPSTGTTRLWQGNLLEGSLFGFRAMASGQMSSATMLFGWWPGVILAEWGVLELMTNPFSDFTRGLTAVRGWYTCDVGVSYPGAFSYASSIT